ncbi:MAG: hypothetical protein JWN29_121 [Acidimicrobiales bacterium]|nr:hypothetical protein [Acidimicrobiales bacterium]
MNDLEERLRSGLDAAAATQDVPAGFDDRVAGQIAVVRRRRAVGRGALAAAVVVGMIAGMAALRQDPSVHTVAGTPAREPGWHAMAEAPISPRMQHLSVAMGDRVLVWGGSNGDTRLDGAVYDAADDTWTKVPAGPFRVGDAVGAWTGHEAIVVSGERDDVVAAAYDPVANAWRTLAAPPLGNGASALNDAVWTGTELVVVGIDDPGEGGTVNQVAVYDPATDSWRKGSLPAGPMPSFGDAVWTGTELAVVGRVNTSGTSVGNNTLQVYDPTADRWREVPWGLDGVRGQMTVAWTGSRLFVGGGHDGDVTLRDAALVDLATGMWERVPDAPVAFAGSDRFGELWTGTAVLTLDGEGARPVSFDPTTRAWQVGPASPIDHRREEASWAWLGRSAVVWGGGFSTQTSPGISSCCTLIEAGELYTPDGPPVTATAAP